MTETLRLLDLFSGIGGFSYAAERLVGGYRTVQFVENNAFCQQVLRKHWSSVSIHDDIQTFFPAPNSADVICGGFPCQDISCAGKQAGIRAGTRSGLFYEMLRIIRTVRPRYVVLENVAAIRTSGLDIVLGEMAQAGYDCEWACIRASDVGACHRRDRWWCVAYAQSERRTEGTGRCTEQTRQKGPRASNGAPRSDAPDSTRQRQQKHHIATFPDQARQTCWHDAPRYLNPDWRSYVSKPVLPRGDDGLSDRVDRIHALGNAVVPHVAAIPLRRILEIAKAS